MFNWTVLQRWIHTFISWPPAWIRSLINPPLHIHHNTSVCNVCDGPKSSSLCTKPPLKTCYPLLRGILQMCTIWWKMGWLWLFSCNSERITHCCCFFFFSVFFLVGGYSCLFFCMLLNILFPLIWAKMSACVPKQSRAEHEVLSETCGWSSYLLFCFLWRVSKIERDKKIKEVFIRGRAQSSKHVLHL